jgi:hypothetical protein
MPLRDRLRRLREKAQEGAVLIHQRDGTVKAFGEMEVFKQMFLAKMDLLQEIASESEVLSAVRNATLESRTAFEQRFGPIRMVQQIIAGGCQGAWVKVLVLTEDGRVEKTFHEGGSEEAVRIRQEARGGTLT